MLLTPALKYLISFFTWVRLRYFGCFFHNNLPQRLQHRAEEVVLQSGALVALAKDPRSALAPDAAACNSPEFQFQRLWALFNPLPVLNVHSPLHKIKIRKNVKTLNVCVNVFAHGRLTVSNPPPHPCTSPLPLKQPRLTLNSLFNQVWLWTSDFTTSTCESYVSKHESPCWAYGVLGIYFRASSMLGKHSTSWTMLPVLSFPF